MKEIVTIQLGNCGTALGYKFWEDISDEHGIDPTGTWCGEHDLQLQKITSFFNPGPVNNFVPRAILVDLDKSSFDYCRSNPFGRIFRPDNFVFADGASGASNNFAKGHYSLGPQILDDSLDVIRREVEMCDWLNGFQMVHSMGGGTGAGLGSLILQSVHEMYPKTVMTNYTVTPSAKVSDTVVEPYNAVLALPSLINNSDITVCLDNEALYDICHKTLRLSQPTYDDLNHVMAKVMSGVSATYRFPATNHCSWRVLSCLAPSPKLHFFVPGFVPLASRAVQPYQTQTVQEITGQMLGGNVLMASVQKNTGKYLSAAALFRGCIVSELNANELLCRYENKNSSQFVSWMPYHFMKGICVTPPRGLRVSATFLANHTSSAGIWSRVHDRFSKLFKKKAFLHWYTGEGMSEADFKEAEENLKSLVKEYKKAEGDPPPGWVSPQDNPVVKKAIDEEKLVRVVDIITIEPRFAILKVFRRSIQCYQIMSLC